MEQRMAVAAVAEAVAVAHRVSRKGGCVVVDPALLPQSLAVLRTRCLATGVEVVVADAGLTEAVRSHQVVAGVVQVPGADGVLPTASDRVELGRLAHANDALLIAAVDLLALTLIGSAATLILSAEFLADPSRRIFEYAILVLLSTLGMMVLISAGDLIMLYLGLELMSLALYVVAASNRDNAQSTDAGLKYFVPGALSSCMPQYGA